MKEMSEKTRKHVEEVAQVLGRLPRDREEIVAMLAQAYAEGVKIGASIDRKSA